MAYSFTNSKGVTYYLHTRRQAAASGKERVLYFFSKEVKDGAMDAVFTHGLQSSVRSDGRFEGECNRCLGSFTLEA